MKTISIFLILGIIITVIAAAASASNSGISNIYSKNDLNQLKEFVVSKQGDNGLYNNELKDTYYAVSALQRVSEPIGKTKELCNTVKSQLNKNSNIETVFYGVSILSDAKCLDSGAQSLVDTVAPLLKSKINDGDLNEIYQAVNTIFTIQTAKLKLTSIDNAALEAVVAKLVALMDNEDGTFKLNASEEANLANTGLAYFTLARLSHRLKSADADKLIANVVSKVGSVMSSADESQDTLSFGNLQTTSSILHGVLSLSSVNDQITDFVSSEQINSIAEYLLKQKNVESLSDAYYLILGLKRCQKNSINQPLHLNILQTVYSNSLDNVKVQVQDIFGQDVSSKVVVGQAVLSSARSTPLISNVELTADAKHIYSASSNFESNRFKLGSYIFDFKVTPVDSQYGDISVRRVLTVSGSVVVKDFKVSVADTKEALGTATSTSAEFGKRFSAVVNVNTNQFVKFFFRIVSNDQPFQAKQAAIQLYSSTGVETVIPVTFSVDAFSIVLASKELGKRLGFHSGVYNADLIIGDNSITPIKWNFGEIALHFDGETSVPLSRFEEPQTIAHKFRTPEKRPPQTISDGFTLLILSPVLIFLLGLLKVGINFKRFPTNNVVAFVSTLVFIGCICSVGLLIVNYWIGSTMDVTLKNLALLLIPTVFFGHKTLSYMNQERSLLKEN